MSSFTKDELRAALTNHGIELPASSAKKEELVALYEEFVEPLEQSKGEFSSDDDEVILSPGKKRTSRKAATPVKTSGADKSLIILEEVISESNGVEDLAKLTDEELAERLRQAGVPVGPIVDTTRSIYEKKLAKLLGQIAADTSVIADDSVVVDESAVNGSTPDESVVETSLKNGEFSADEEVVEEDDEAQPSVVIRKAATPLRRSTRTSSKAANSPVASPSSDIGSSLRQRFTGVDLTDSGREGRFTPTPRRSIHSYKVTETTTEKVIHSPDGNISRDVVYVKETSESSGETGGKASSGFFSSLAKLLFLVLIAGVAIFLYSNYGSQLGLDSPAEQLEAPAEAPQPEVVDAREPAPDQASVADV